MALTKEQIRIYNDNARKRGLTPIKDDSPNNLDTFSNLYSEVLPYTTGLHTPVVAKQNHDGTINTDEFEKNIQDNLNDISNATQYLFNAIDAAKDGYDAAVDAANSAAAAQKTANDNQKAINEQQEQINQTVLDVQQAQTDATNAIKAANDAAGIATSADETAAQAISDAAAAQKTANDASSAAQQAIVDAANAAGVAGGAETDAAQAITDSASALEAAQTAQNDAINALQTAAATAAATASFTQGSDGETHSITIKDNQSVPRQITLLPMIAAATSSDNHKVHLTVSLNGTQLYSKSVSISGGYGATIVYSHSFVMNPGAGDQTYTVEAGANSGGTGSVNSISDMTVLATQYVSSDFVIS